VASVDIDVRLELLTAVTVTNAVIWDVTPSTLQRASVASYW
jgi:hypothetical protein